MSVPTIVAIGTAIKELVQAAMLAREKARQSEEWTVAQEVAFERHIATQTAAPHWQPDDPQAPNE